MLFYECFFVIDDLDKFLISYLIIGHKIINLPLGTALFYGPLRYSNRLYFVFLTGVICNSILSLFPVNSAFFNKNKLIDIYVAILIKSQFCLQEVRLTVKWFSSEVAQAPPQSLPWEDAAHCGLVSITDSRTLRHHRC